MCSLNFCLNNSLNKSFCGKTFKIDTDNFTKHDPSLARQWLNILELEKFPQEFKICSYHFLSKDIIEINDGFMLRKNCLPCKVKFPKERKTSSKTAKESDDEVLSEIKAPKPNKNNLSLLRKLSAMNKIKRLKPSITLVVDTDVEEPQQETQEKEIPTQEQECTIESENEIFSIVEVEEYQIIKIEDYLQQEISKELMKEAVKPKGVKSILKKTEPSGYLPIKNEIL